MNEQELYTQATRRAKAKQGWYIHAVVYVLVNLGQILTSLVTWHWTWSFLGAMGWGLGLAIHGIVVFGLMNTDWNERMIQAELRQLRHSNSSKAD